MAEKKYVSDNAQLMAEWDWKRNLELDPMQISLGSHKKAWWKCRAGHKWYADIHNRSKGCGCPYCSGRSVVKGKNDLQTINPTLANEWNYKKNFGFMPTDVSPNSSRKVWWKCSKGHEWQATVANRSNGTGCPICSGKTVLIGYNDLETINPDIAFEWDYNKNGNLRPSLFTANSSKKVWWKCSKGHEWQAAIFARNTGSGCPICAGQKVLKGYNDLQTINPLLIFEWNYEKNNGLNPDTFTVNSSKKVWWKCAKGHEWDARISSRNSGNGCPYCAGQKVLRGFNDLQTVKPQLCSEWNFEKNGSLKPYDFMAHSGKKVWWRCSKEHEWEATINKRSKGNGCPYCSGRSVIGGQNDLLTVNPTLAKEWNQERNITLKPEEFSANSNKKVWWKCIKGHEWQATIDKRNRGSGCPVCNSERKTSFPEYALMYYLNLYGMPALHSYKEYGFELDVYIPSKKIAIEYDGYFWHKSKAEQDLKKNYKCRQEDITLYRIREGLPPLNDSSVDYLVQKRQTNLTEVLKEVLETIIGIDVDINIDRDLIAIETLREHSEKDHSILMTNPGIAKEWHYERNGNLQPDHFTANSGRKVWWKCKKGHEWKATIDQRNSGKGCPYCSGRYPVKGKNDLQTVKPAIASEWNYEKNIGIYPPDVLPNSNKKVWWKCIKGHEWQATIASRNNGTSCPYCTGRYAVKNFNDLQTTNPSLAKEWNYERNVGLTPGDVTPNSGKKVWWKCGNGHEWQATIDSRSRGCGCPYCAGRLAITGENDLYTINPALANEWNTGRNKDLTPLYVTANSGKKVWWQCSKGHEWQATISSRNKGNGCPYCANRKALKGYSDLQTINPLLANEWNFEKNGNLKPDQFTANSGEKVWWKCAKGHEWDARISSRNSGNGCPHCAREKRRRIK